MKQVAREWIEQADRDLSMAIRESRVRRAPNLRQACFLCHESAEKFLKACLIEAGIAFPRTHDLTLLLDLLIPHNPMAESWREQLLVLSAFSVNVRYPEGRVLPSDIRIAIRAAKFVRHQVRAYLET
ncbi:HEPN domain-containing protein [candidate division KSB1 bacterium]|nr:HEPN domain-containing protein [candidate division KSB1 bacterium]